MGTDRRTDRHDVTLEATPSKYFDGGLTNILTSRFFVLISNSILTVMFVAVEDPHVTTVFVENGKCVGRRTKDEILEAQALADAMMFGWEGWRDETHVIVLARGVATSVHIDI